MSEIINLSLEKYFIHIDTVNDTVNVNTDTINLYLKNSQSDMH